jgi:hypothetical protein
MNDPESKSRPLLFISHKHADAKIASVVGHFITTGSAGGIEVFQSSSPYAANPKSGNTLKDDLVNALWKASALILVYTGSDHDWSYCMWEAGVALNPASPKTRIILFQCSGTKPPVFHDQVYVNVRNLADVQRFTNEFLTDPMFIPSLGRPVTHLTPNGDNVATIAADFFQRLSDVLPKEDQIVAEWPAFPFLQLSLEECAIDKASSLSNQESLQFIQEKCVINAFDRYCGALFEMLEFTQDMSLKHLADRWSRLHPDSQSDWAEDLSRQIAAAARWEFPPPVSSWMKDNGKTYAPILTRVRKMPAQGRIQFDIYFDRLNIPIEEAAAALRRPESGKPQQTLH